jgi:hypothetical protein
MMMIRLWLLSMVLVSSPALAGKALDYELGDLTNGIALIKAHCGSCDAATLHDPMALAQVGEAKIRMGLTRGQGVGPLKGWSGKRLHELEAWDVIRYLRGYSISLADLMPNATHYSIEESVPNEWGRERLWRKAKVFKEEPEEDKVRGKVVVVWEVPGARGLTNVSGDTSVIGGFESNQKKAFILLRTLTVKKKKIHVGLAMDQDSIKIIAARAVHADGSKASSAVRSVRSGCLGKGRRDNYRRFTCGRTGSLARPLWNEFIVGSEQIYAYEIAERENDFGSDLGSDDEDDDSESSEP